MTDIETFPELPTVAIVGRPNVGKSTLMNRIIGRREAIVQELPGVTRDRKVVPANWNGRDFLLVDTGGWMSGGSALDKKVSKQSEKAISEADVVLFVVDANVGVTDDDLEVARLMQRIDRPVMVIANKVDDTRHEANIWDLLSLGLGDPYPVSALHGRGTGDFLDVVVSHFPPEIEEPEFDMDADEMPALFSVALVGRPNVGKSTLFNRLIGEDRSVVHDMPGTTRDSVDTVVETEHGSIKFIDTAGMRRKSRIDDGTEYFSMVRALQSVDEADAALLVIDATEGITHQDQRLAERIDASGSPIVVLLNKWELMNEDQRNEVLYNEWTLWSDNVEKSPGLFRPHHNLAVVLMMSGQFPKAYAELKAALKARDLSGIHLKMQTHFYLGQYYRIVGQDDNAMAQFRAALKLAPLYAEPYQAIADILSRRNEQDAAEAFIRKAISIDGRNADFHLSHGIILLRIGRPAQAIDAARRALLLGSDARRTYAVIGSGFQALKDPRTADHFYRLALQRP